MPKIERLTPGQEAELPRFRARFLQYAIGGSRIDRPVLEKAMADAYAVIGKPAPKVFIFDSPSACMLAIKIFEMGGKKLDQLGDQLRDQLRGQLWGQLAAQLRDQLRDQLVGQLWGTNCGTNCGANFGGPTAGPTAGPITPPDISMTHRGPDRSRAGYLPTV